jgi:ankyrin repeat protein
MSAAAAAIAASSFVDAAACGDLAGVKDLLSTGDLATSAINAVDKDGRSAFHYACLNDDVPLLTVLLADSRVNVSLTSPKGDTGLHMAALYAALEALAMLRADARIPLGGQNMYGETPLHMCAGSGDKAASKAAALLLSWGAPLDVCDRWGRGPVDVSKDNGENSLVTTFRDHLAAHPELQPGVNALSAAYTAKQERDKMPTAEKQHANKMAAASIFGQLGSIKLKKTTTVEKTMFNKAEGTGASAGGEKEAAQAALKAKLAAQAEADPRRALSKLVDFPGDVEEIKGHLASGEVNAAGLDAFGLAALHKFASWNKTELLELLLPHLSSGDLDVRCPDGKTALHWAVEMAAVSAVRVLVAAGCDASAADGKGRTVHAILDAVPPSGVIDRIKAALVPAAKADADSDPDPPPV